MSKNLTMCSLNFPKCQKNKIFLKLDFLTKNQKNCVKVVRLRVYGGAAGCTERLRAIRLGFYRWGYTGEIWEESGNFKFEGQFGEIRAIFLSIAFCISWDKIIIFRVNFVLIWVKPSTPKEFSRVITCESYH